LGVAGVAQIVGLALAAIGLATGTESAGPAPVSVVPLVSDRSVALRLEIGS